jgi:hypothetical protein
LICEPEPERMSVEEDKASMSVDEDDDDLKLSEMPLPTTQSQSENQIKAKVKRTKYKAKSFEIEFDFVTNVDLLSCADDAMQFIFDWQAPFVPISECIKQSIIGGIQLQSFIVDKVSLFLFVDKLKLFEHFESLNRFYFMTNGDLMNKFCATLYAKQQSEMQCDASLFNFIFFSVAKRLDYSNDFFVKRLNFIKSPLSGRDLSILMEMVGDSHSDSSHFLTKLFLNYRIEWPLTEIITASAIKNYNFIFVFFLYLHYVRASTNHRKLERTNQNKTNCQTRIE